MLLSIQTKNQPLNYAEIYQKDLQQRKKSKRKNFIDFLQLNKNKLRNSHHQSDPHNSKSNKRTQILPKLDNSNQKNNRNKIPDPTQYLQRAGQLIQTSQKLLQKSPKAHIKLDNGYGDYMMSRFRRKDQLKWERDKPTLFTNEFRKHIINCFPEGNWQEQIQKVIKQGKNNLDRIKTQQNLGQYLLNSNNSLNSPKSLKNKRRQGSSGKKRSNSSVNPFEQQHLLFNYLSPLQKKWITPFQQSISTNGSPITLAKIQLKQQSLNAKFNGKYSRRRNQLVQSFIFKGLMTGPNQNKKKLINQRQFKSRVDNQQSNSSKKQIYLF